MCTPVSYEKSSIFKFLVYLIEILAFLNVIISLGELVYSVDSFVATDQFLTASGIPYISSGSSTVQNQSTRFSFHYFFINSDQLRPSLYIVQALGLIIVSKCHFVVYIFSAVSAFGSLILEITKSGSLFIIFLKCAENYVCRSRNTTLPLGTPSIEFYVMFGTAIYFILYNLMYIGLMAGLFYTSRKLIEKESEKGFTPDGNSDGKQPIPLFYARAESSIIMIYMIYAMVVVVIVVSSFDFHFSHKRYVFTDQFFLSSYAPFLNGASNDIIIQAVKYDFYHILLLLSHLRAPAYILLLLGIVIGIKRPPVYVLMTSLALSIGAVDVAKLIFYVLMYLDCQNFYLCRSVDLSLPLGQPSWEFLSLIFVTVYWIVQCIVYLLSLGYLKGPMKIIVKNEGDVGFIPEETSSNMNNIGLTRTDLDSKINDFQKNNIMMESQNDGLLINDANSIIKHIFTREEKQKYILVDEQDLDSKIEGI